MIIPVLGVAFYTRVTLKTNIDMIKQQINELKDVKLLDDNTILKYKISGINHDNDSLLELSDKHICLRFFPQSNDRLIYKDNFVVFISLISFLKEHYEIRFADIYGYIIGALSKEWEGLPKDQTQTIESLKERIKILDESNCNLSFALIASSEKNAQVLQEFSIYKEFGRSIIENLKIKEKNWPITGPNVLLTLGIDLDLVKKVENCLQVGKS